MDSYSIQILKKKVHRKIAKKEQRRHGTMRYQIKRNKKKEKKKQSLSFLRAKNHHKNKIERVKKRKSMKASRRRFH